MKLAPHPRITLTFQTSGYGDSQFAFEFLRVLTGPFASSNEYKAARALLLQRDRNRTLSDEQSLSLCIRIQPPFEDTSNMVMTFFTAPSRDDTIAYYTKLLSTLDFMHYMEREGCGVRVEGFDLDLSKLETPADVIVIISELSRIPLRITKLVIHLAYSWDRFDQTRLLEALNQPRMWRIDHVKFIATTGDNLAAALESLPMISQCRQVELADHVMYGNVTPLFVEAFARVMMTQRDWKPKKLTLRVAHFDQALLHKIADSNDAMLGELEAMEIYLSDACLPVFLRALATFGRSIRFLEIHVWHAKQCAIHLGAVVRACPSLHKLGILGAAVFGLDDLCDWIESNVAPLSSLVLRDVLLYDLDRVGRLAEQLGDPGSVMGKRLLTLELVQRGIISAEDVRKFALALGTNKNLCLLALNGLESAVVATLESFNSERLHSLKYAFLSVIYRAKTIPAAMGELDMWSFSLIIQFAGIPRRREMLAVIFTRMDLCELYIWHPNGSDPIGQGSASHPLKLFHSLNRVVTTDSLLNCHSGAKFAAMFLVKRQQQAEKAPLRLSGHSSSSNFVKTANFGQGSHTTAVQSRSTGVKIQNMHGSFLQMRARSSVVDKSKPAGTGDKFAAKQQVKMGFAVNFSGTPGQARLLKAGVAFLVLVALFFLLAAAYKFAHDLRWMLP